MQHWPADQVERRALATLIPHARNARTHSDAQIEQLVASIREWGWTIPVLVDESGSIIAGHGRVRAAERLSLDQVPCIVARGWTDAQKRAYLIADNKLTEQGGWDDSLLGMELSELQAENFDLGLLGFGDLELVDLLKIGTPREHESEDRELTPSERERLNIAWKRLLAEWAVMMDAVPQRGMLSTEYTKGALAVYFMRALLFGEDIPRPATTPYTLHRLNQMGDGKTGRRWCDVFKAAQEHVTLIDSIRWGCQGKPSLAKFMQQTLAVHGYRYPMDFPSLFARDLIDEFTPAGGAVLDPCHGWGGRMLGFLLSKNARTYLGYDVDELTVSGVRSIFDDLRGFVLADKQARFELCPFQSARLEQASFDFALTSPPYYDVERYDGELQSYKMFQTFTAWVDGFYIPLLAKTAHALKSGSVFALQIGNQAYPLEQTAIDNLPASLEYVETRTTDIVNTQALSDGGQRPEDGELLLILRKR
jgi:hypothetical protein